MTTLKRSTALSALAVLIFIGLATPNAQADVPVTYNYNGAALNCGDAS